MFWGTEQGLEGQPEDLEGQTGPLTPSSKRRCAPLVQCRAFLGPVASLAAPHIRLFTSATFMKHLLCYPASARLPPAHPRLLCLGHTDTRWPARLCLEEDLSAVLARCVGESWPGLERSVSS